jgi:hypothetical protein
MDGNPCSTTTSSEMPMNFNAFPIISKTIQEIGKKINFLKANDACNPISNITCEKKYTRL